MNLEPSFWSGVVTWGVVREVLGFAFKEWMSGRKAKYKVLSDEAASIIPLIDAVVKSAVEYYSSAGNEKSQLSTTIKIDVSQISQRYSSLSDRVKNFDGAGLNSHKIIGFRRAITSELDSSSRKAWNLDNYGLQNILTTSSDIRDELNNARFTLAK